MNHEGFLSRIETLRCPGPNRKHCLCQKGLENANLHILYRLFFHFRENPQKLENRNFLYYQGPVNHFIRSPKHKFCLFTLLKQVKKLLQLKFFRKEKFQRTLFCEQRISSLYFRLSLICLIIPIQPTQMNKHFLIHQARLYELHLKLLV
jgi:hypothetical protein